MRCNIIGCGETGNLWDGSGFSIGVNDAAKWGKPLNALVCVNVFSLEPHRNKIVRETKTTHGFYSAIANEWKKRPDYKEMVLHEFKGHYVKGHIFHSQTSAFIAICLAAQLGFTEIVLYGCDLVNHNYIRNNKLDREVKNTVELCKQLEKLGIKVYIYRAFGSFKNLLPSLTE